MNITDIEQALNDLKSWLAQNPTGYDPYDIKEKNVSINNKYLTYASNKIYSRFPLSSRKFLRVKKSVNPTAVALAARGYIRLYEMKKNAGELEEIIKSYLDWLKENRSPFSKNYSWGHPFSWKSKEIIPALDPSSVITSIACHAFLDAYYALKDPNYLNIAKSCCNFILEELGFYSGSDGICFKHNTTGEAYTHNANMFCAAVLIRTWKEVGVKEYLEASEKAVNYTVTYQNEDGSWYYYGPPDKINNHIDGSHTGFLLENLKICNSILNRNINLKSGINFYKNHLFKYNGMPKFGLTQDFPIDLKDCAQGISTFIEFEDLEFAQKIAEWTINNMKYNNHFKYQIFKHHEINFPYSRWQSWIFWALCKLYKEL